MFTKNGGRHGWNREQNSSTSGIYLNSIFRAYLCWSMIFTKCGEYVENGVAKRVEWSKYGFFENPRSHKLNRYNSAADGTYEGVPDKSPSRKNPRIVPHSFKLPHLQTSPTLAHTHAHTPPLAIILRPPRTDGARFARPHLKIQV